MDHARDHTDDRQRVREASDIVRVVGEHLELKPKGREYVGLCPFHDDHNPSMSVVPAKQIFHCFVCGAGGDVFSFIQRYHAMDFREALEFLAARAGLELARRGPRPADDSTGRVGLIEACTQARDFFRAVLRHPEHGQTARDLIRRRAITPEALDTFEVGAAPDRWDGLLLRLNSRNQDTAPFLDAGLLKRRESGSGLYDAFRHRLIFPIHDQIGRVVAFGARRINDDDEPKYLNSPESKAFSKSSTLYALHQATRAIQRERVAVVCEGYVDAIACHQHGFTNAVATLGTALTKDHAAILRRLCHTIVLLFDSDDAGQRAADRAIEVFFAEPVDVKIATLSLVSDAKDPDELLKRPAGADLLRRAIDNATDLLEHRLARLRDSVRGKGMSQVERALLDEIDKLVALGLDRLSPTRRTLIVAELTRLMGADTPAPVLETLRSIRTRAARRPAAAPDPRAASLTAAESLLGCLLVDPALWLSLSPEQLGHLDPSAYASPQMRSVAQRLHDLSSRHAAPDLGALLAELADDTDAADAAVRLAQTVDRVTDHDRARLHEHWRQCLTTVARESARRQEQAQPADPAASLLEVIETRRRRHAALGGDPRALPRPGP